MSEEIIKEQHIINNMKNALKNEEFGCICSPNMNFSEIPLQEQRFWCDGSQQMAG